MRFPSLVAAGMTAGVATLGYSMWEARQFGVLNERVPILPKGTLRILHLSDLHLTPSQTGKQMWLRSLDQLAPDMVIVTGDFMGHRQAAPVVLEALQGLLALPGAFVLGSNDYHGPRPINPISYLLHPSQRDDLEPDLPWGDLVAGLRAGGWFDLSNAEASLEVAGLRIALRGVDDPHIGLDDYQQVAGPFPQADLRIGVSHAPYLRILDAMAADGADLILAGHTHGGQICLPGTRAMVTNCDLDTGRASGLSRHRVGQVERDDTRAGSYLHVSRGIGTAPTAPIRLFCPPRATELNLVGRTR